MPSWNSLVKGVVITLAALAVWELFGREVVENIKFRNTTMVGG